MRRRIAAKRRGAILWMVLICLPVVVIIGLMAINIAYMNLSRTELRIATDASSRAGGRTLALSGDVEQSKLFARDAAARNFVAGAPLLLADSDFEFGRSERSSLASRYEFVPDPTNPNSLRLSGRRTDTSPSGVVKLFAPKLLSINSFSPKQTATSTQIELDVCLVVDRSGSMAYADDEVAGQFFPPPSAPAGWDFGQPAPPGCRWFDAVNATQAFLNELAYTPLPEKVGLVTYSQESTPEVPLGANYAPIMSALDDHTNAFPLGATNVGDGIIDGINALQGAEARPWATKVIILLTDGIHNFGANPIPVANTARAADIIVYSITFSDEADIQTMKQVAKKTGGFHVHAATGAELVQAFREVAHSLPTLLTQ